MASSRLIPLAMSVIMELVAMAAAHPSVWKRMSAMRSAATLMPIFITSPHCGLPTSPRPSGFSSSPTLWGSRKCAITRSEYIVHLVVATDPDTSGSSYFP